MAEDTENRVKMPDEGRRPSNEPVMLPSQAEGDEGIEPETPNLRTPGKAEGTREDVDEALSEGPKDKGQ